MTRIWNQNRHILTVSGLSLALLFSSAGCKKNPSSTDSGPVADISGSDPADVNNAPPEPATGTPTSQPARVLGTSQQGSYSQQGESYSQSSPAPIERQAPPPEYTDDSYASDVDASQVAQTAPDPPPPLPEYEQPPAPEPDDLWTPGYWDYGSGGFYWVPGAWVAAPYDGALWTPPWWGFYGGHYGFHRGYWGRHIGFYGGVNYGFGYVGHGYEGGYWRQNHFVYNTAVNRINTTVIHNTYVHNVTVINNTRISYNGGRGGLNVRPQASELAALHENHTPPMQTQVQHAQQAGQNRQQFFSANHGRPEIAVAARPIAAVHQAPPAPAQRAGFGQQGQPGRPEMQPSRPGEPQTRPGQPQQARPSEQQVRPNEQQARPGSQRPTPQQQPQHTEPPQARPQPQRVEPQQARPQPQSHPEPQQQTRPAPQQQARPEPQARPQPAPQPHAEPQPQHAAPAPHPAPQPRPEQAHPEPPYGGEERH